MKTRLLKRLRSQAKKKYTLEPYIVNDKLVDYRIMMNDKKDTKILFHHPYLDEAIAIRNSLRRNDIIQNIGIIRYHQTVKKYK
jgi:hypothetical protein